jgi:hypothetical protein
MPGHRRGSGAKVLYANTFSPGLVDRVLAPGRLARRCYTPATSRQASSIACLRRADRREGATRQQLLARPRRSRACAGQTGAKVLHASNFSLDLVDAGPPPGNLARTCSIQHLLARPPRPRTTAKEPGANVFHTNTFSPYLLDLGPPARNLARTCSIPTPSCHTSSMPGYRRGPGAKVLHANTFSPDLLDAGPPPTNLAQPCCTPTPSRQTSSERRPRPCPPRPPSSR